MAQFEGDDANSTDLVLEMNAMVNGQWGPYLMCNPLDASKSTGRWDCKYSIDFPNPPNYPDQCTKLTYDGEGGVCLGHVD
jgi:hypothetical protein